MSKICPTPPIHSPQRLHVQHPIRPVTLLFHSPINSHHALLHQGVRRASAFTGVLPLEADICHALMDACLESCHVRRLLPLCGVASWGRRAVVGLAGLAAQEGGS